MSKLKKINLIFFALLFVVPALLFSACGEHDDSGKIDEEASATFNISFEDSLPVGINSFSYETNTVTWDNDFVFSLIFEKGYSKGTISVLANNNALTEIDTLNYARGLELKYKIKNVQENKTITISGSPEHDVYNFVFSWKSYSASSTDRDIDDYTIDINIKSVVAENNKTISYKPSELKNVIDSNGFNPTLYYDDILTISIYSYDNYTSFVDNLIMVDYYAHDCTAERIETTIDNIKVEGYKAIYTINVECSNTEICFDESVIAKAETFSNNNCYADIKDVNYNIYSCPTLKVVDEASIAITTYTELIEADSINVEINPNSNLWKYILNCDNLVYSLNGTKINFVEEDGKFMFKNVPLPHNMGNYFRYTLEIENVQEIVSDTTKFDTLKISTNTDTTTFADEQIVVDEKTYYCKDIECHIVIEIDSTYTSLEVEFSNSDTDKITKTVTLSQSEQTIIDGFTIAEYIRFPAPSTGHTRYVITFDGKNNFYRNIKLVVK